MVVRRYLHGGLFGPLLGGIFAGASRALREARIAEYVRCKGVPTYFPLAAVTVRFLGIFYRAYLISRELLKGKDLLAFLESNPPLKLRRKVFERAGRAVRKMHDLGVYHGDLHLKNLFVRTPAEGEAEVYILDWDKSRASGVLSKRRRILNLARLDRSGAKHGRRGVEISALDRLRFLRGYLGGDRDLFSAREFLRRELAWKIHGLAWALGDLWR
jgi:3-deoxy-D-manno-octulosonic acid kinase